MKLKKLVVASMVVSSMATAPLTFAASNPSDNSISSSSVQEKQIPKSLLDGKSIASPSGRIPIKLKMKYGEIDDRENTYSVNLILEAGQYLYHFLWDFGPTNAGVTEIELTNVKTGKVTYMYTGNVGHPGGRGEESFPYFLGKGKARYATCDLGTVSFISLDDRITGIKVAGYEGMLLVGPTIGDKDQNPGRIWHWK